MDVLLDFAGKGSLGPIHGGMRLQEAARILGPGSPHPAIRLLGSKADEYPYPYSWGNLSLDIANGLVTAIRLRLEPGETFAIPDPLKGNSSDSIISRETFLAALKERNYRYHAYADLTFEKQSAFQIQDTKVVASFFEHQQSDHIEKQGFYLTGMYLDS